MNSDYKQLFSDQDVIFTHADGRYAPEICFDNAATTPPFRSVLQELAEFIPYYSSVHRGAGYKSRFCSDRIDGARAEILSFVHGDSNKDIVLFVKNTTDAINLLAHRLSGQAKHVVLASEMEHHSNDLPWRRHFQVEYIRVDHAGRLMLDDLAVKLRQHQNNVRLVTVTGASNVTGYLNPIHEIAALAHHYGAEILVDAAQLAPHWPIDMRPPKKDAHIDYLAFSAHKMYAPFGVGVLIGPRSSFEQGIPAFSGGGTAKAVTHDVVFWEDPPLKEEAGTPNLLGIVALQAALRTLNEVGMERVAAHEFALTYYAAAKLKEIPGIQMYAELWGDNRQIGIIPFNLDGFTHAELAARLSDEAGIAVRSGCFCAHPYVQKLLGVSDAEVFRYKDLPKAQRPGMVRLSFGLYNDTEEIDLLTSYLTQLSQKAGRINYRDNRVCFW